MVAAARSTPTIRQRELAERLRELRLSTDLTVEAVAESLLVSSSKISRIETATRRASVRDVRDLCLLYRVPTEERDRLMALAAQALETSWYQDADIGSIYATYVGLELAARSILNCQALMVPGLLQTADYATALLSSNRPPDPEMPERIASSVAVRLRRQEILRGATPPSLHVIFDEAALQRPVGSRRVMAAQIEKLLESSDLPNVTVQVVPVSYGAHAGLDGRFSVLRFGTELIRDTVYIEGLLGELFLDKEGEVQRYIDIFEYLSTSVALSEAESRKKLHEFHQFWSAPTH